MPTSYRAALENIPHLRRHPQMTPWVGELYGGGRWKRIVFIGESHYLPEKSTIHRRPEKWYASTIADLRDEERVWTNTAAIIASGNYRKYENPKAHGIYRELEKALLSVGFPERRQMLDYAAFYNFFQRPALKGDSIGVTDQDAELAVEHFWQVTRVLKAELVCLVSMKAWNMLDFRDDPPFEADGFPHPASAYWNMKRYQLDDRGRLLTGREKLVAFLRSREAFTAAVP